MGSWKDDCPLDIEEGDKKSKLSKELRVNTQNNWLPFELYGEN